jgi:hypothetical protein
MPVHKKYSGDDGEQQWNQFDNSRSHSDAQSLPSADDVNRGQGAEYNK